MHTALSSFYFFYILIAFGFSKHDYILKTTKGKLNMFFFLSYLLKIIYFQKHVDSLW